MKLTEYVDSEMMMLDLASRVAGDLENILLTNDRASLVVPGGSTPGPMFDVLSAANIDWARVDVMLTDERWVPLDHSRSNTGMLKARLFKNRAAAANLIPFYQDGVDSVEGAASISDRVTAFMPLGVVVLGMGTDMHCASLFPGAPELQAAQASDAPAVYPMSPGDGLEPRVTLSARALASAMSLHILIIGDEKRIALEAAQDLPFDKAPIGQFISKSDIHWAKA
ncbi:MAG: 6-phosphogluconolactonase [Planktomarina sp.]